MLIQTQNLTKRYGDKTVVQQLNLSIPQGQLVAAKIGRASCRERV